MARSRELEMRSSAVTLSDMEVFIFPRLMYGLLLANVMSPRLWSWREDPWFEGIDRMKPYRRISRLKQFIMDHYVFNLDLDTWGLTTKEQEIERFRDFIDKDTLAQSNALFGYEGDKYYFSIDIRTHFGLDKYEGDVIPYWKTETVEAMDAFKFKPQYANGAGECVSLSALYAAALFVVARIPLKDIYLLATPLHSQNFVDVDEGILTNNRRLLTKSMWFNGTALSAQARRALENERVTIVAHETGHIHAVYDEATINPEAYAHFSERLRSFLRTSISEEILVSFLRHHRQTQNCFQVRWPVHGTDHYIAAEHAFSYEHGSPYRLSDSTRAKLLDDIDEEEYQATPLPGRMVLNDFEVFIRESHIDCSKPEDIERLKYELGQGCDRAGVAIDALTSFCRVEPRLPDPSEKSFVVEGESLGLRPEMQRTEVIARLEQLRAHHPVADLAFYAYRDLNRTDPWPFLLAALERNPVSLSGARDMSDAEVIGFVSEMPDESIYDEPGRLAQPDEVWNYGRGDGAEKAILLANILRDRRSGGQFELSVSPDHVRLMIDGDAFEFASTKGLTPQTWPLGGWLSRLS
ncbi:MAG: hypothetical protein E4G93_02060 [Dehalococcoidia bacterium]|nr:MAG: hypothetical protein E4G93_02060 [Dehalococcoidia bacterium]